MYLISLFLFSFHLSLSQPHLPLSQVFSKDEILVYTPDRNYTAHQFSDLLTDAKYGYGISLGTCDIIESKDQTERKISSS